jgi:inorganic pyrophosphatase
MLRTFRSDGSVNAVVESPRHRHVRTVFDLPRRTRRELELFYAHAVALEGKSVRFLGWEGTRAAVKRIRAHIVAAPSRGVK